MKPENTSPEADTPSDTPKRSSRKGKYILVFGLVVYCTAVWYVGWQDIKTRIAGADLSGIAYATVLIFTATWMRVVKWLHALGAGQHALGLFFLSKATGDFTQGRLGEFAPMAIRNHRTPKIGAWIMFDRVIEILVTLALGLYGLAMIELLEPWQFMTILASAILGTVLGVYLLTHRRMFLWIAGRFKHDGFLHKVLILCAAMSGELRQFMNTLPVVLPITVVTKLMDLFAIVLIFRALATSPSLALIVAAKCALAIVSFGPTPTATGVPHVTQAWLMNHAAGIPDDALAAGIAIEVIIVSVTFWTSLGLAGRYVKEATVGTKAE